MEQSTYFIVGNDLQECIGDTSAIDAIDALRVLKGKRTVIRRHPDHVNSHYPEYQNPIGWREWKNFTDGMKVSYRGIDT